NTVPTPYQHRTIYLPTPTTVGDGRVLAGRWLEDGALSELLHPKARQRQACLLCGKDSIRKNKNLSFAKSYTYNYFDKKFTIFLCRLFFFRTFASRKEKTAKQQTTEKQIIKKKYKHDEQRTIPYRKRPFRCQTGPR
ncbi:MAG: hypothetical protein IJ745_07515, partial [Bacteroidales bacterium]|nr:hypothetical protein [Bacteroidales bacterium]